MFLAPVAFVRHFQFNIIKATWTFAPVAFLKHFQINIIKATLTLAPVGFPKHFNINIKKASWTLAPIAFLKHFHININILKATCIFAQMVGTFWDQYPKHQVFPLYSNTQKKMKKMSLKSKLKQKYAKPLQQELFTTNGQDIFQQETSTIWRIFTQPQRKHMTEGKLKTLKNKAAMRYLRVCFQMMWDVEIPCNGPYASLLCFDSIEKFDAKRLKSNGQILSQIKAQSKLKCLHWISILLLCRDPVENWECGLRHRATSPSIHIRLLSSLYECFVS